MNKDNHQEQFKFIAAFAAIYIIWGSTYLAIKFALETIPPFLMMGIRSASAGIILYLWNRSRGTEQVKKEHWLAIVIIAIAFFLVGHGLLAWGQKKVPSGLAALLVASEPLWIATIESLLVRDFKVTPRTVTGLVLGFIGISLLITPWEELGTNHVDTIPALVIVLGALSWSGGAVYSRVAKLPKSPILAAGLELIVGGLLLIAGGLLMGEGKQLLMNEITTRSLFGLGYLILFGSVITFTAYVWLLSVTSATRISTHSYVNPVIAVFLGWAIAGESLSLHIIVPTVIVVISVYLVLRQPSAVLQPLEKG